MGSGGSQVFSMQIILTVNLHGALYNMSATVLSVLYSLLNH